MRAITGIPHYPQWRVYPGYEQDASVRLNGVEVTRRRHPVPDRPQLVNRLLLEIVFGLRAALTRWGRPDVVVSVSPALFASMFAAVRARLQGVPFLVWVQDVYSLGVAETGQGSRRTGRLVGWAERLVLRSATTIVVIHERFRSYLVRELGLDPRQVNVVRNWSHVDVATDEDAAALRARLGWDPDTTVVLHAGNMGAKQDLENVVRASRLAEEHGDPLLFVLMGDGNRRAHLEALGTNRCLAVMDPLPKEDFASALRAADILLVNEKPGLTEMAVPSKLTSYFAAGRPAVVATDQGSVTADEVHLSGGGIRVDAGCPQALVDAALELRANPERAAGLAASGMAFRESTLTEDASLEAFQRLLRTLAA